MKKSFISQVVASLLVALCASSIAHAQTPQSSPPPSKWVPITSGTGEMDRNGNVRYRPTSQCQYRFVIDTGVRGGMTASGKVHMYFTTVEETLGWGSSINELIFTKPLSYRDLYLLHSAGVISSSTYSNALSKTQQTLRVSMARVYQARLTDNTMTSPQFVLDYYDPEERNNFFVTVNPEKLRLERLCF